jgi:hypothetical protein
MEKVIFTTINEQEMQMLIIDCVNSCLKYTPVKDSTSLISFDESCDILNITRDRMYRLIYKGVFTIQRGSMAMFVKDEVDYYYNANLRKKNR